jgi:hypothetical protein
MISIEDRGSTRSGRTYLPDYIERVPDQRRHKFIENLANSRDVDVNSLSSLMADLSIAQKVEELNKTLHEWGCPSVLYTRKHILYPDVKGNGEYEIKPKIISMMQYNAFSGKEDEDPSLHLTMVHDTREALRHKNVPKEFVLLTLFHWSLKGKSLEWLQFLPRYTIASWKDCTKEFMHRFNPFHGPCRLREITNFCQNIGESFTQDEGRFFGLLMRVPNHGFMDHLIVQHFYGGLNDESKQMFDACA